MTKKEQDELEGILKKFRKAVDSGDDACTRADKALWHLLEEHKSELPAPDGYFMKAFRQVDVTPSGHVDMAIWHLLGQSKIFWKIFNEDRS